jgi:hypothetical protein
LNNIYYILNVFIFEKYNFYNNISANLVVFWNKNFFNTEKLKFVTNKYNLSFLETNFIFKLLFFPEIITSKKALYLQKIDKNRLFSSEINI